MNLLSTTAMHKQLSILSTCDSYVPSLNDSFVWTIDHAFYVCTYWLIATGCTFFSNTVFASSAWLYFLFKTRLEWMFFLVCASSAWLYFLFQQSLNECSLIICSSSAWLFLSLFERNAWMNVLYNLRKLSMTTVYVLSFQTKLEWMFFIICASSALLFFLCLKEMQFFFAQVRNR